MDLRLLTPALSTPIGASVIKCCYAAKGIGAAVIGFGMAESTTTNGMVFDEKQLAGDEKTSLNVSRLLVSPACIAGVRVSRDRSRLIPFVNRLRPTTAGPYQVHRRRST